VTVNGAHQFKSLELINGTILTQGTNCLWLDISGDLTVDATSKIDVTGKGYGGSSGPGRGGNGAFYGAGAGYGGAGGNSSSQAVGGGVYGSLTGPVDLGSGGGSGNYVGGNGGGAVWLTVGGTLTVNGALTANGVDGQGGPSGGGGGASGGSLYLTVGALAEAGRSQPMVGLGGTATLVGAAADALPFITANPTTPARSRWWVAPAISVEERERFCSSGMPTRPRG